MVQFKKSYLHRKWEKINIKLFSSQEPKQLPPLNISMRIMFMNMYPFLSTWLLMSWKGYKTTLVATSLWISVQRLWVKCYWRAPTPLPHQLHSLCPCCWISKKTKQTKQQPQKNKHQQPLVKKENRLVCLHKKVFFINSRPILEKKILFPLMCRIPEIAQKHVSI